MMVIVQPRWWPVSLVPGQQGYKIPGWGTFMNTYAIWRSNYGPSENMPVQFPTTTLDYSFTRMLNIPVSGNYTFEYSADNNLNISIDDVKKITITASNAFTSSNISSIFLTAGTKVLNCSVYNDAFDTLPSIPWYTRTIGFALTIRNNSNQIIWDTRSAMQEEIVYVGEPYGLSGNMMTAIAGVIAASGNQMGPAYADIYTTPGAYTWTKRPKTRRVDVLLYGGGGGGGGGGNPKLDTYAVYGWWLSGGGGGRGGQVYYKSGINGSKLKSTGTVIVGAGGLGGSSSQNLGTGTNGFAGSATLCSIFKDLSTITTDQAPGGQGGTWYADPFPHITEIAGAKGGGNPLIDSGYGGDAANYNQIYFAQYQGTNGGSSANTWPMTTTSIIPEISYIGTATAVTNPNWNTFLNNYAVWDNAAGNASPYILHRFRGIFTGTYGTYKLTVGVANMPTVQGTYLNVYVDDDFITQTSGTTVTNVLFLNNTTTITFEVFNVTSPWVTEALTTSTPNFNPPGFAAIITTTTTNTVLWNTRSNRVQLRNNVITSYTVTNKIYQSSGGGSGGSVQLGLGGNPYLINIPGRGSWSGEHTYVGANSTGYFPYVAYPYVSPTYSMVVRSIPNSAETNYVTNSANMVSGKSAIVTNITGTQRLIPGPVLPTVVGTTTTNILYACGGAGGSYNYYYPIQSQTPTGGAGGFPGGGGGGGAGGGSYAGFGGFAGGKGGDGLAIIISYT